MYMSKTPKKLGFGDTKNVDTGFYDDQGVFALDMEAERVNQYAKPGTTSHARQDDPFNTSFPSTRYRHRRP